MTAQLVILKGNPVATLSWKLRYSGLGRARVTGHVHVGQPWAVGPKVLTLCEPCVSGGTGRIALPAALAKRISGSDFWPGACCAYVDLHTPGDPGGVLRGELVQQRWRGDNGS